MRCSLKSTHRPLPPLPPLAFFPSSWQPRPWQRAGKSLTNPHLATCALQPVYYISKIFFSVVFSLATPTMSTSQQGNHKSLHCSLQFAVCNLYRATSALTALPLFIFAPNLDLRCVGYRIPKPVCTFGAESPKQNTSRILNCINLVDLETVAFRPGSESGIIRLKLVVTSPYT